MPSSCWMAGGLLLCFSICCLPLLYFFHAYQTWYALLFVYLDFALALVGLTLVFVRYLQLKRSSKVYTAYRPSAIPVYLTRVWLSLAFLSPGFAIYLFLLHFRMLRPPSSLELTLFMPLNAPWYLLALNGTLVLVPFLAFMAVFGLPLPDYEGQGPSPFERQSQGYTPGQGQGQGHDPSSSSLNGNTRISTVRHLVPTPRNSFQPTSTSTSMIQDPNKDEPLTYVVLKERRQDLSTTYPLPPPAPPLPLPLPPPPNSSTSSFVPVTSYASPHAFQPRYPERPSFPILHPTPSVSYASSTHYSPDQHHHHHVHFRHPGETHTLPSDPLILDDVVVERTPSSSHMAYGSKIMTWTSDEDPEAPSYASPKQTLVTPRGVGVSPSMVHTRMDPFHLKSETNKKGI
ncbi:hypothetical protein HMI54_008525 [Coelomomyces lativittatus]|nr:hypothetical protein HMI55_006067 [Coelomomyces lativittatus]KAJ1514096.1 hypothetical protein HMI56_001163 [Coelomomyces lativittatus]KAJ1516688.1 hypothetical protein HMI54_008525 [Coelomomyces lativittatus]